MSGRIQFSMGTLLLMIVAASVYFWVLQDPGMRAPFVIVCPPLIAVILCSRVMLRSYAGAARPDDYEKSWRLMVESSDLTTK